MLFNSIQFLFFFPIVTLIYFLLPHKWRWLHLLVASCVFYMAFIPVYILILVFTIVIDYIAGILIENAVGKKRKWFLTMSIIANVGVLCVFKYYNFFVNNIDELLKSFNINTHPIPLLNIILPLGLSFHTFQAMSYTIEVYRGNQKAERHFGIYALYVMFYPQLVAGPIERPQNLLHQFREEHRPEPNNITEGLRLMLWGMFKKVIIADRLAILTVPVFNNPHNYPGISLLIATIMFSFQIFCDFSGYSDIALGSAKVMGFTLMKNFNWPYVSRSMSEFWKRWHISLSTWFKDYLYISLGGNRVSVPRWYFNLFFVFLVSGFWHGANWTFIAWGALHGFYLVFAIVTQNTGTRLSSAIGLNNNSWVHKVGHAVITFGLVAFAWIFFRANTIADACFIIRKIPSAFNDLLVTIHTHRLGLWNIWAIKGVRSPQYLVISFGLICFIQLLAIKKVRYKLISVFKRMPFVVRLFVYYLVALVIILSFIDTAPTSFIYFQF